MMEIIYRLGPGNVELQQGQPNISKSYRRILMTFFVLIDIMLTPPRRVYARRCYQVAGRQFQQLAKESV